MYIVMGDFAGIHKTTAGRIITRVTNALITLRPNYIYLPRNAQELQNTQTGFRHIARFIRVVGAVDGTHIKRISPGLYNCIISYLQVR